MTLVIRHTFVDPKADKPDTTVVRPSDWNATHTLTGTVSSSQTDLAGTYPWTGVHTYSKPITVQGGVYANQTSTGLALGIGAGETKRDDATDSNDVFVGYHAGQLVPAGQTHNTFIGCLAGPAVAAGAGGTLIGQKAGVIATSVTSSVAVGGKTANNLLTLDSDVFVGYAAAQFSSGTNVGRRTFIGYNAGQYDSGDYNIMIGYNAGPQQASPNNNPTTGERNIGIGANCLNNIKNVAQNTAIGYEALNALVSNSSNTAIGYQAGRVTTGFGNTFVGGNAGTSHTTGSRNVYIGISAGASAPVGTNNTFISGNGTNDFISNVYFGSGYVHSAPVTYTINGTGGSGTNIAGAGVKIAAGKSTGSALGGEVTLQYSATSTSGTALNTLSDGLRLSSKGSVVVGNAALATNAADGFLYIPTCSGPPTGTPTAVTGRVPMIYDTANDKFYFYNGSWKGGTTPGAFT